MQRWIVIGLVTMVLGFGGAVFAYMTYKDGRPAPMWVPLPLNPELPDEKRKELVQDLKVKLSANEILMAITKDLKLAKEWSLPSDKAASEELGRRLFVRLGDMESGLGRVPSLNVGVNGKVKERELSGKIATRMTKDVWNILGIKKPSEGVKDAQ